MRVGDRRLVQLGWLLLAVGAVRLFLLVLHDPMYGYANNYDFIRVSSWFHLWADPPDVAPGFDPLAQHPSAPISSYRIDPRIDGGRYYLTSDLLFVWAALKINAVLSAVTGRDPTRFDLRTLGVVRALALVAAGAFVTSRFRRRTARAGFVSAAIFAIVLADPVFSLLFNSLYSGFSTVLFTYLAAALVIEAVAYGPPDRLGRSLLLASTFALLALSKVQYVGLPLALSGVLLATALTAHRSRLRRPIVLLGLALAIGAAVGGAVAQTRATDAGGYAWSMRMGAATDTYLGAALPHMSDPAEGLRLLGLPERCGAYVGKDWYAPGMQPPPCPEVETVPRWKLLRLAMREPSMVVRASRQAIPLLQPFVVRYLGQVEGRDFAQADLRPGNGLASVALWTESLPPGLFAALLGLTLLGAFVAAVDLAVAPRDAVRPDLLLPSLVVVLGLVQIYSFASSWVGAGLVGLARHSLVGQLALLCLVVAAPCELLRFAGTTRRLRPDREHTPKGAAS